MVRPIRLTSHASLSSKTSDALRRFPLLVLAPAFLLLAGCGENLSDVPSTLPVTGTVTLNGSPLPDADVMFFDGSQYTAFGKTDGTGHFSLKTRFNSVVTSDGAPAREYHVTISKMIPPKGMTEEEYEAKRTALKEKTASGQIISPADQVPPKVEMIPPQYSQADRTELKALVKFNQTNDFPFNIGK